MKRILLTIAFDGTMYHGWQYQPNALTIQEVLQKTVSNVLGRQTSVTGCSRTDAGVHAKKFCCHIDCEDNIPETAFTLGVNSALPNDIAVIGFKEVENDFHARYSCLAKNYVYYFYFGTKNPFFDRFALKLDKEPNLKLMNCFCDSIVGEHDFYGFSSSGRTVSQTIRNVTKCSVYRKEEHLCFDITANGFLYNMVRILAGTALDVGYGKISQDISERIFENKDRSLAGKTLAPNGLFLNEVYY